MEWERVRRRATEWRAGSVPSGYTFVELVVVGAMLMILASAILPLAKVTIQRQREVELRRTLREMRVAIDRYKDAADQGLIGSTQLRAGAEGYPTDLQSTYSELCSGIDVARRFLRAHAPGDRPLVVFVALPGGPEFTAAVLACLEEDAVAVPIPHKSTALEWRRFVGVVEPDVALVETVSFDAGATAGAEVPVTGAFATWADVAAGRCDRSPRPGSHPVSIGREAGMIQFTSGSTGVPKGIVLSRRNISAYLENNTAFLESLAQQGLFCPMPQCHAFGGTVVMEGLWAGASVRLSNQFVPANDIAAMQQGRCGVIQCSPSYARLLLQLNVFNTIDLPALHTVVMGTSPTDQELVRRMREARPDIRIVIRYGLTETMGPLTRLVIEAGGELEYVGLVGEPVPGVALHEELSRCADGEWQEVRASGDIIAAGELTSDGGLRPIVEEGGYFPTGDLGFVDARGRLHLRGRKSVFIKRHGFRIDPFEIEDLLKRNPEVTDAAVFGVPDPVGGEKVVACIETAREAPDGLARALIALCKRQLSPHKVPERILVMNPLPRTVSGKPDRRKIKAEVSASLGCS